MTDVQSRARARSASGRVGALWYCCPFALQINPCTGMTVANCLECSHLFSKVEMFLLAEFRRDTSHILFQYILPPFSHGDPTQDILQIWMKPELWNCLSWVSPNPSDKIEQSKGTSRQEFKLLIPVRRLIANPFYFARQMWCLVR